MHGTSQQLELGARAKKVQRSGGPALLLCVCVVCVFVCVCIVCVCVCVCVCVVCVCVGGGVYVLYNIYNERGRFLRA